MVAKNTICLWYDGTALDAAKFYALTFPDTTVGAVYRAPGDFPSGKAKCQQGCSQLIDLAPEFGIRPHRNGLIDLVSEPECWSIGVERCT